MGAAADTIDNKLAADGPIYVTMRIDQQTFAIEVKNVRDVLRPQKITPILLAPPEVAGSINLRGRIITVIDLRRRLNLPPLPAGASSNIVVVELKGELYSLIVDSVGDVLTTSLSMIDMVPANLSPAWKAIASAIYKLENDLIILVEVKTLLKL